MSGEPRATMSHSDNPETHEIGGKEDVAMVDSPEKSAETESQNDSKHEEKLCPLFMDGLPSDFSTNPGLAAIASLLEEDESNDNAVHTKKEYEEPPTRSGGGKIRRTPARSNRKDGRPYNTRAHGEGDTPKETSVGETHLFLKMWKL